MADDSHKSGSPAVAKRSKKARIIMTLPRRKFLHLAVGAATLPTVARIARAQNYPTRPVTMVVTYPAGSGSDVLARIIGPSLSEFLGQQVIIENVGGAGGTTGVIRVARAAPDGYQFVLGVRGRASQGLIDEVIFLSRPAEAESSSRDQTRGNYSSMGIQAANQLRQHTPRHV
jgi:hypothetical protein